MKPFSRTCLPLLLAFAGTGTAQTVFQAYLNGGQQTPPNSSPIYGDGQVILDPVTKLIRIYLSGNFSSWTVTTGAEIRMALPGTAGGVVFPLMGVIYPWIETAGPLTPAQVAALRNSQFYFNVRSVMYPAGEVRGQITPSDFVFDAFATGAKETPPTPSPGTATGSFILNNYLKQVTYDITASGLTSPITQAHIHEGPPGAPGPVVIPVLTQTGPNTFSGTSPPLTDLQIAKLRSELFYLHIHTAMFPGGEIRGQLAASLLHYGAYALPWGWGCPGSNGLSATLGAMGLPIPGQTITIVVTHGLPNGFGFILVSFTAQAASFGGCPLLVALTPTFIALPVQLDGIGSLSLPVSLPLGLDPGWVQLQYAGLDPYWNGLFTLSNGLSVNIND